MYTLVRRYIKTAIAFLGVGLILGAWMIARRELWGRYPTRYEISAHTHALLVGFVMMMILGVALWLFPRPERTDERYRPAFAQAAYWMLTVGTGGRLVGELLRASIPDRWLGWAIVAFAVLQVLGVGVFFHTMWSRIRPVGSAKREAQGERF